MQNKTIKTRIIYALIFILLVLTEVLIALYVHDSFIRPFGGDMIIIGVLYCFVRIFFPKGIKLLPLWLFLFAVCVEVGQALNYVELLGLGDIEFFKVLMGTSFSWYDILCYAVGSVICFGVQLFTSKIQHNKLAN